MKDFNDILSRFNNIKQEIADLEKQSNILKKYIEKKMDAENVRVLTSSDYQVTLRRINKETVTKKDIPSDIWAKYAKRTAYNALYITKIDKPVKKPHRRRSLES